MKMGAGAPMILARGRPRGLLGCQGRWRHDGNVDLVTRPAAEFYRAVHQGEDRVVAAQSDVGAGVPLRAALADQDVAGDDALATGLLEAEAAAFGVAPVAG